jgi:magnesium transporter
LPHRRRHRQPRRPPPGAPPGVLTPAHDAHPASFSLIAYDSGRLVEQRGNTLADIDRQAAGLPKVWIDVQGLADLDLIRALGERYALHPLMLADIVHVHQRPKIESYPDHLFIVLRMPHQEDRLDTEQLSIVLGRDFVLTFQERPGDCFDPVRERLRREGSLIRRRGVDYLAYALIDTLVDSFFPVLERYGELIEDLEEQVLKRPQPARVAQIQLLRRELLELRRVLWAQREVANALLREDTPCIEAGTRVFLRDCADHAFQLIDMVEIHREVASGLLDLHLSSLSARMNEIMKVLTIISTIFIPLGFIAGVYGMNFDRRMPLNMPELGWRFGYFFALALMLAVALGMLVYFRRKGWLGARGGRSRAGDERFDPPGTA